MKNCANASSNLKAQAAFVGDGASKPVAKRRKAAKPGGKIGRPRKDPRHACIRIFKVKLGRGSNMVCSLH